MLELYFFDIAADFIALYDSIKCGEIFAHKYKKYAQ